MKLKYYLRGLGIGVLVTTIIFMIGLHVNEEKIYSDEAVIARAKKLGMVEEKGAKTLDELEAEQKKQQEQREEEQKEEEQEKEDQQENKTEDTKSGQDQKTDEAQAKQPETVKQVQIDILPGEYSATICQKLFQAGLVADQEDFNNFITDSNYDSLIQPGTFTIPEGSSYEEIAKILTTKQENR